MFSTILKHLIQKYLQEDCSKISWYRRTKLSVRCKYLLFKNYLFIRVIQQQNPFMYLIRNMFHSFEIINNITGTINQNLYYFGVIRFLITLISPENISPLVKIF